MSDIISRQDAIDALERRKDKTAKGEIGSFYNTIIQHDIDAIVELPSAQPDLQNCLKCIFKPFKQFQPEPQWIPCSDCERRCEKWENSKTLHE